MSIEELKRWLEYNGFKRIDHHRGARRWRKDPYGVFANGPIVVILKKLAVRVELELPKPRTGSVITKKGKIFFEQTHERIGGAYYKNISVDAQGHVRGLGFESNPRLNYIIYNMQGSVGIG